MTSENKAVKLVVQKRIVTVSVILFAGKLTAYYLTNSVGILTDALESTVNVVTGFISLYSIGLSLKPRDENHPFGHGKVESISASVEGFLILLAGLIIIFEAIKRLFIPAQVEKLDIGIIIVALSGLINFLVGLYSIRTGKKHNSIALVAGGKHLQSDTYSSIGLIIGLILLFITKIYWLDSAIALIFGSVIIFTGYKILKITTSNLMDKTDFDLLENIASILWKNKVPKWINIHNLKLVKYGDIHHIECDLTLPWYITIEEGHRETDLMRNLIMKESSETIDLIVHTDPCKPGNCRFCSLLACAERKSQFENQPVWSAHSIIQRTRKTE
jgi:cation diffusion facilitator family transporter